MVSLYELEGLGFRSFRAQGVRPKPPTLGFQPQRVRLTRLQLKGSEFVGICFDDFFWGGFGAEGLRFSVLGLGELGV